MRGLNVNGFIIVETLGSGRAGVLYLARHPDTGQEAIICLTSADADGPSAKVFLEEATSLRPTTRELSRARASDGRAAMLAVLPRLPSEAKTVPLPGAGNTRFPETELLPSRRASRLPLVLFVGGLVVLGAGLGLVVLRQAHRGDAVVSPSQPPAPVEPPRPEAQVAPPPPLQPVALPQPAPKQATPKKPRTAVCDVSWRRAAEAELASLKRAVAARNDDRLFRRYEQAEESVMLRMQAIGSAAECAQVNDALDVLIGKYSD
ncbi:MAG: hypothetical protein JNM69_20970 [Archangium sp.]|nr:hypothetical protein [Archangium sp.]